VELSDSELVQRCQAGDVAAFQELVQRYYRKVYMLALGILNHREDAMEVAQETFFRAFRKIKGFGGRSTFYTWLYRITVNLCIDFRRRHRPDSAEMKEGMSRLLGPAWEDLSGDPYRALHNKELGQRLLAAIQELTPAHKAVIVMRAVEGLSYKDIGRILGCSEGTVMSRLHYARKKLQGKLAQFL